MKTTYVNFVYTILKKYENSVPIYSKNIALLLADEYDLPQEKADAATAVAIKRIIEKNDIPELRQYQKGIYYRAVNTPFGERGINKEQLIADKYLLPDNGYEAAYTMLHRMGLTTQMPGKRVLVTNVAKDGTRSDDKLGVTIKPPKVAITKENKRYLQLLDILELMDRAPIDEENPYVLLAKHVKQYNLQYELLLAIAAEYYTRNTVLLLGEIAKAGRSIL